MRPPAADPRLGLCRGPCGEYYDLLDLYLIFAPQQAGQKKGRTELHHCKACFVEKVGRSDLMIRLDATEVLPTR